MVDVAQAVVYAARMIDRTCIDRLIATLRAAGHNGTITVPVTDAQKKQLDAAGIQFPHDFAVLVYAGDYPDYSTLSLGGLKTAILHGMPGAVFEIYSRGYAMDHSEMAPLNADQEPECPDCSGSLPAILREHAASLAAMDDDSTIYTRDLLEKAAAAAEPKTCSTCKHWRKTPERVGGVAYPRDWPGQEFETRFCWNSKMSPMQNAAPRDGVRPEYDGGMECGPDFGCVNHET